MLERLTYRCHTGESLTFGKDEGYYCGESDIRDFSRGIICCNGRVSGFTREMAELTIPIIITAPTMAIADARRERLLRLLDRDVAALQAGRLELGEWHLPVWCISGSKGDYLLGNGCIVKQTLRFAAEDPMWRRERTHVFPAGSGGGGEYPLGYPRDLAAGTHGTIANSCPAKAELRLIIEGPAADPRVWIGEGCYGADVTVDSGERLTIDTEAKTLILRSAAGEEENVFALRAREGDCFAGLPEGEHSVSCSGDFPLTAIVTEKRSEPTWN